MLKPVTGWQRTTVLAAAEYIRSVLQRSPDDEKARLVYDGLLELLDPTKRAARMQREMAAARATTPARERRATADRRAQSDRRKVKADPPGGVERRRAERRAGDRRNR